MWNEQTKHDEKSIRKQQQNKTTETLINLIATWLDIQNTHKIDNKKSSTENVPSCRQKENKKRHPDGLPTNKGRKSHPRKNDPRFLTVKVLLLLVS